MTANQNGSTNLLLGQELRRDSHLRIILILAKVDPEDNPFGLDLQ